MMNLNLILSCCVSCFLVILTGGDKLTFQGRYEYKYPFQDPSLAWDKRVDDLVGRLSLEEIVPQSVTDDAPAIPRLGIKAYKWDTECIRGQRGTNTTAFPQSLGLAASFSNDLLYKMAEAISLEVRAHYNGKKDPSTSFGLSCFSPVINIMRHPLWGRNQETYGECPFLSGTLVQNYVAGLQGNHPRYVRVNAGCKHFDVHGGPENIPASRFSFDAKVSMRDWRMTFLPQFKMCVEAGTYSLMCSYNSIHGIPACAHRQLLTDIARKEWGFRGYVVSDAGAIPNIMSYHHYLNNSVDTAAASIKAGCNLELHSTVFSSQIDAVKQGKLSEEEVRENIKPLFYTRMRLGEFDPPEMIPFNTINMSEVQSAAHRELAIQAASMSSVLLKNNGNTLPIKNKISKLAVVGPMANNSEQLFGSYSSNIVPQFTKTPYEGLQQMAVKTSYAAGCDGTKCSHYNADEVYNAVNGTDVTIVCLGTGQAVEGEGNDRQYLDLPGQQLQLLKDVAEKSTGPVIVLLFNAGPLDITWAKMSPNVDVIMECFFSAQATGDALYRTLTAADSQSIPAGRLPATWPANIEQIPPMVNYTMAGRTYRYYQGTPLYPFGYGLSYSQFMYVSLTVSPSVISPGQEVAIYVDVVNRGPYDADEVVQVYMHWMNHTDIAPHLQLVAYERLPLKVNEQKHINFLVTSEQMALWVDENTGFKILPGKMMVSAGGQQPFQRTNISSNVLQSMFTIGNT